MEQATHVNKSFWQFSKNVLQGRNVNYKTINFSYKTKLL